MLISTPPPRAHVPRRRRRRPAVAAAAAAAATGGLWPPRAGGQPRMAPSCADPPHAPGNAAPVPVLSAPSPAPARPAGLLLLSTHAWLAAPWMARARARHASGAQRAAQAGLPSMPQKDYGGVPVQLAVRRGRTVHNCTTTRRPWRCERSCSPAHRGGGHPRLGRGHSPSSEAAPTPTFALRRVRLP